jgi:alpha-glucosidase
MMLFFLPGSLGFNASVFFSLHLSRYLNAFSPGLGAGSVHSSVEAQEETASVLKSLTAGSAGASEVTSSYRAQFTVPPEADVGAPLLPNVKDPEAVDPQLVCPGYSASNVIRTDAGLTATLKLAGKACNVYGTDIEFLNLTVEYQSADRLSVQIMPAHIDASNATQYFLPQGPVLDPTVDPEAGSSSLANDLRFVWRNDPTFSFSIYRKSTGDTVFSTAGSKIVFENQFLEFASPLPENYNLYGLGETIHSFRLGNNYTKTMYNADTGDPIDE